MKILMVNKFYHIVGGSERYFFDLYNLLESKGHKVIPFSMKDKNNEDTPYKNYFVSNVDYKNPSFSYMLKNSVRIIGKTIYSLESRQKIEKLIEDTKPDIAHIHLIGHHISPSILVSLKKFNIPVVQTLHEYKLICPNYRLYNAEKKEICEKCKGGKYYNAVLNKCLRKSTLASILSCIAMYIHKVTKIYESNIDLFITPSKFTKEKMMEFGINKNQIEHISHFININSFKPNYNHSGYILYFGRLSNEKGIYTLLKAMREIRNTELFIVGSGDIEKELKRFIEREGLVNVKFFGFKSGEELKSIIRESMFVIVPSEWYETFGYIIIEAFASGKPVIGSNIGGISELINENNGLLFKPRNDKDLAKKIKYLSHSPSLLKKLSRGARKFAEKNFTPDIHFERIMREYKKLVQS